MNRKIDWQRFKPLYWFQNAPTDWDWDATLNGLLDRHVPTSHYCTVKLGGVEVWAENWPYAYGSPYDPKFDVLPSVATRKRLRQASADAKRESFRKAIDSAEAAS